MEDYCCFCYTLMIFLLWVKIKKIIQQVMQDLHAQFALKSTGAVNYFLGFEVHQSSSGLHLSQTKYAAE